MCIQSTHNITLCATLDDLREEAHLYGLNPNLNIQGSAKRRSPGLVNFVTAVAYIFCLALPSAFTQPENHLLTGP